MVGVTEARGFWREHPGVAVVCGRRRERDPAGSVYNQMADMEVEYGGGGSERVWGDAMMRGGGVSGVAWRYEPGFIAGEEPEFAARRMRLAGHRIRAAGLRDDAA